jgi:hypothetical protein
MKSNIHCYWLIYFDTLTFHEGGLCDRMVVGFTTTYIYIYIYAIIAITTKVVSLNSAHGVVYSMQLLSDFVMK